MSAEEAAKLVEGIGEGRTAGAAAWLPPRRGRNNKSDRALEVLGTRRNSHWPHELCRSHPSVAIASVHAHRQRWLQRRPQSPHCHTCGGLPGWAGMHHHARKVAEALLRLCRRVHAWRFFWCWKKAGAPVPRPGTPPPTPSPTATRSARPASLQAACFAGMATVL